MHEVQGNNGNTKGYSPTRSWRDDVDKTMNCRGLEEGHWEDREEWNLFVK